MSYVFIEDFKYGIDRRRPRFAGVPGTLWDAQNVVLSRGGDLVRTKKFVPAFTGLEDTFGLVELNRRNIVFGSDDLAASMPLGVEYQRLQAPSASPMVAILDAKKFDGKVYAIAEYADGSRHHFYDGARVTDWDTIADGLASPLLAYSELADKIEAAQPVTCQVDDIGLIITARVPGTSFSISAGATNGSGGTDDQTATATTPQANVAGSAAISATRTITVTGGAFDPGVNMVTSVRVGVTSGSSVELLGGPVDWFTSNSATANAIALAINDRTDIHGYTATAVGAAVTIAAPTGTTPNTYSVFLSVTGAVSLSGAGLMSGGANAVAAVAQVSRVVFGGTFDATDILTITVNGTAYSVTARAAATASRVLVAYDRVWAIAGPAVYYCVLNDPTDWTTDTPTATASGVIVISTTSDGAQRLTGIEKYQGDIAIFSTSAIMIYRIGTDPDEFGVLQELENTGTIAGRAVRSYGANDLFYLDTTGIRSLQARDSSNAAFVSDAGTAFDPFVQDIVQSVGALALSRADAVIQPETGAYWFAIDDQILVLTNYPGTGIRGWTRMVLPFTPTAFARTASQLLVRDEDTIYIYGGASGEEYGDETYMPPTIRLPFMSARDDAGFKHMMGFDMGAVGAWQVTALQNPNDETETVAIGILQGVTYSKENTEQIGETTHVAFEFTCKSAGFASLSNIAAGHEGRLRA